MHRPDEYQVEGYGIKTPEYDQPYLSTAALDPAFIFAHGGDPEAQQQYQNDLVALAEVDDRPKPTFINQHPSLQTNAVDPAVDLKQDASDYSDPPQSVVIDKGIETEKHNADGSPKTPTEVSNEQPVSDEPTVTFNSYSPPDSGVPEPRLVTKPDDQVTFESGTTGGQDVNELDNGSTGEPASGSGVGPNPDSDESNPEKLSF
jgi:hypothetical protein